MEYEKHEHGVLNEEHRNFIEVLRIIRKFLFLQPIAIFHQLDSRHFIFYYYCGLITKSNRLTSLQTVYRTVTLSSDSTQECAENLLSSIERTAYALDYELKMLKFNHARLKIDKIQPSTTDDDQPALPSENAILMDLPLATTHPKPSEETIDHTADFSSTTEFRVRTEPNNFTGTQKPKAQTMDNFKKAIPSIFLRKSLEKRKEIAGQPVYDRDETEDVDLDGAARRHDTRSRRRSMVLNDTLNSADQAISSQRGTSSGTVRRGGRQDKSAEVHVTSSISCGIPLSSKRSATKLEASTSFAGHKTRSADEISVPTALPFVKSASDDKIPAWNAVGQKRMSNPITETPRTTITSRPQTPRPQTSRPQTPSELISSNSTSPNTFDRQRTESTPPPPVYPSRRSLDHKAISRPPSPDAIVPVSSTIVDQPMNAIVRRSSGSKTFSEFVVSEVELPPLSLDFQAMRRSSSKSNLNAVTMKKTEATATLLARSESPDPSVKVVASNSPPQSPSKWAKRKQVLAVLHKQSGLGIARDFVNDNVSGEDGE
ncbi:LOW QUALITY PROTEIN: hypothetical protein BC936DRAFT_139689 [Jimgerdemannia flammicorona]|uniref:Uncharacterized protein n=1 Tax=Jimgerdemannia flammicorona TaxID=994334 RepID=A0A433B9E5_9FUNG|nr:LOW QUALITY PROTEIN: hypothetical protein BC936DRAFT_139689 [Jimgerdemannia flammicorona]